MSTQFIATLHSKHIFWDSWDNIFRAEIGRLAGDELLQLLLLRAELGAFALQHVVLREELVLQLLKNVMTPVANSVSKFRRDVPIFLFFSLSLRFPRRDVLQFCEKKRAKTDTRHLCKW